jgi:electron transport complex protein RnfG
MTEPKFRNQFLGKNPETFKLKVKKDGGDVDAISAATITSRAVCDGISKAWVAFGKTRKSLMSYEVDSVSAATHTGETTKQ